MKLFKHLSLVSAVLLLAACAGKNGMPAYTAPAMSGTWKDIGAIERQNIVVAYETGSVRKNGAIARLRDRKIVVNPAKADYTGTPRYKIAVGEWEFHCTHRSYRLASVRYLDESGNPIREDRFTPTQIRHMPLTAGTIAEKQFNIACK